MLALAIPASAAAGDGAAVRTTAKGAEPFDRCFAAAQDRASRPWSFVPKASGGGTFSNAGASGVRGVYFLEVADRGASREIRLSSADPDSSVVRAIDSCI
jgi:hypothetical protein